MATFSVDAQKKYSGLPVGRFSHKTLQKELEQNLNPVETYEEEHVTPSGISQGFKYCRFVKQK